MVRETSLSPDDLIYPLFVTFGKGVKNKISSMPGCFQMSVDNIVKEAQKAYNLGIPAIILFGIPRHKDAKASEAYSPQGDVQKAIKAIKNKIPELVDGLTFKILSGNNIIPVHKQDIRRFLFFQVFF